MEITLMERLKSNGFTVTSTGGGCTAWVKYFEVKNWPTVESFCQSYAMITQDSSHEIDDASVGEFGLVLQYNEYSCDENSHFFTDVDFKSAEELHNFLLLYAGSTEVKEFPDFDNSLSFGVALNQLKEHGFVSDAFSNVTPSIAFNSSSEGRVFTQLRVRFNSYDCYLSEQAGKLYVVTQYNIEGDVVAEHEFDNLEQTLSIARAMQIMASVK